MKDLDSIFYRIETIVLLLLCSPLFVIFFLAVKLTSKGPFLFKQKRLGKDKKPFTMYKIRTMVNNAEQLKKKYYHLNQIHGGPVFKIKNDPRYTKIGKIISHTGLDELPQLINVIKGEMSLVGPRPLPLEEAEKVPKKYERRFSVLPGITSPWVIKGSHVLSFRQWMELDLDYIKKQNFCYDMKICIQTAILILKLMISNILSPISNLKFKT